MSFTSTTSAKSEWVQISDNLCDKWQKIAVLCEESAGMLQGIQGQTELDQKHSLSVRKKAAGVASFS